MKIKYFFGLAAMMLSLNACGVQLVSMKVQVHDDDGGPVEGAHVKGGFFQDSIVNKQKLPSHQGTTDSEGLVELSGHEELYVDLQVEKNGYYDSKKRVNVRNGQGREVSVLLRQKREPIAMYVKKVVVSARQTRKSGEQFGYDFMVGDFVSPHGKGKVNDLLITHTYNKNDSWNYSYEISIKFSNPYDGLMPFFFEEKIKESRFKSDYKAPVDGYINEWVLHGKREGVGKPVQENKDKNRNYYFRVRTQADSDGNIESAYYGKIYGEFLSIAHYLNPSPNDRNVEFDPQQNLFKNLKPAEKVWAP